MSLVFCSYLKLQEIIRLKLSHVHSKLAEGNEVQFQRSKSKFKTSSESNGSEVGWIAVC